LQDKILAARKSYIC